MIYLEKTPGKTMQLIFLMAAGGTVFLFVLLDSVFPGMGYLIAEKYLAVPSLLFFGAVLCQNHSDRARARLFLSGITVIWFAAVQLQHQLMNMGTSSFGLFAVVYLLAFPYAWVSLEDNRNWGIKGIGSVYLIFPLVLIVLTGMLLLGTVPAVIADELFWDGMRLNALWHPNITAGIFMVGIGFCLYFLVQEEKTWSKIVLAGLIAMQWIAMALTNSRTGILMTCALLGCTLFFRIWKRDLKSFAAGAGAALGVIAVLFFMSGALFGLHTEALSNQQLCQEAESQSQSQMVQAEEIPVTDDSSGLSPQGSLTEDIWTLNGRTSIWKAALTAVRDNPSIQKWGTEFVNLEISNRNTFPVGHSHNSWIEILMRLGFPGLLLALIYTGIAIKSMWQVFWHPDFDLSKKVVALLVLCLLAAGFLEPYLFVGDITTLFANFLFFFCTGYLDYWSAEKTYRN